MRSNNRSGLADRLELWVNYDTRSYYTNWPSAGPQIAVWGIVWVPPVQA